MSAVGIPELANMSPADLASMGVYAARSAQVDYDDASADVFTVPAHCALLGFGLEVVTAFDGATDAVDVTVDAVEAAHFGENDLSSGGRFHPYYKVTAAAQTVAVVVTGSGSAGAFRLWLHFRPDTLKSVLPGA